MWGVALIRPVYCREEQLTFARISTSSNSGKHTVQMLHTATA